MSIKYLGELVPLSAEIPDTKNGACLIPWDALSNGQDFIAAKVVRGSNVDLPYAQEGTGYKFPYIERRVNTFNSVESQLVDYCYGKAKTFNVINSIECYPLDNVKTDYYDTPYHIGTMGNYASVIKVDTLSAPRPSYLNSQTWEPVYGLTTNSGSQSGAIVGASGECTGGGDIFTPYRPLVGEYVCSTVIAQPVRYSQYVDLTPVDMGENFVASNEWQLANPTDIPYYTYQEKIGEDEQGQPIYETRKNICRGYNGNGLMTWKSTLTGDKPLGGATDKHVGVIVYQTTMLIAITLHAKFAVNVRPARATMSLLTDDGTEQVTSGIASANESETDDFYYDGATIYSEASYRSAENFGWLQLITPTESIFTWVQFANDNDVFESTTDGLENMKALALYPFNVVDPHYLENSPMTQGQVSGIYNPADTSDFNQVIELENIGKIDNASVRIGDAYTVLLQWSTPETRTNYDRLLFILRDGKGYYDYPLKTNSVEAWGFDGYYLIIKNENEDGVTTIEGFTLKIKLPPFEYVTIPQRDMGICVMPCYNKCLGHNSQIAKV